MMHGYKIGSVGAMLLLSSCSVYAPMQGAAPDIRAKGELEATAGWSFTNRLDAGVTYSPVRHLLVRAAGSTKGSAPSTSAGSDSASYARVNQYELAVGTYWPLGERWRVGGLAAYGQAHAQARYDDDGNVRLFSFRNPLRHSFTGSYRKYSGEAYVVCQPSRRVSLGLSYRLVQVRLTEVADFSVPVRSAPLLRSEPMFFLRVKPEAALPLWQLQVAIGSSSTLGFQQNAAGSGADPARQFKLARTYVLLGVALYPHVLWRQQ